MEQPSEVTKILILVADDDSDTRHMLKILLESNKFSVVEVNNGHEMIETVKKEKPALIIADVMMPHINGYEAINKIRKDPLLQAIPVIFISCIVTGEPIVTKIKELPNSVYIDKPFTHEVLLDEIQKLLKNAPAK